MRKIRSASIMLLLCLAWLGLAASQGMGDSRGYDQSGLPGNGNPAYSTDQAVMAMPDYLSPYGSAWQEDYQRSDAIPARLVMQPADPIAEGLVVNENQSQANQLYLQMGYQMLTEGTVMLGEEYILWAKVISGGGLQLYDYNSLLYSQVSVTPGWYKISGSYGSHIGGHVYRFQAAGLSSNDLTVVISPGSYPASHSLTGRVLDQNKQGLSGARVVLINSDGGSFSTTTGESGYYALDVAAGIYTVNAEHPGYAFTSSQVQVMAGMVSAARPLMAVPQSGTGTLPPVFS